MSPNDPPPPADRRQPSLIDTPSVDSATARRSPSLRMLDGLDETTTTRAGRAPNSGFQSTQAISGFGATRSAEAPPARGGRTGWMIAMALALAVLAVLWWWTQGRDTTASVEDANARAEARPALAAEATRPAPNAASALSAGSAPTTPTADETRSAATGATAPVSAETARIETVRDADIATLPASASASATLANARSQSGTMKAASVTPTASAPPRSVATAAAVGAAGSMARATEATSATRPTAGPVPTTAAVPIEPPATVAAAPTTRKSDGAKPSSTDADVTLIDALLSRIGAGNGTTTRAEPTAAPKVALGDLIERCQSRAGKETPEAATCRPRICAGQWGQSDACPAALAPKN